MSTIFPPSMPYDEIVIKDNTAYSDEVEVDLSNTIPTGPIAFIPFVSPNGYGKDNELVYMDAARLAKYGTPNLKKYGLSLYLANRFVAGGGSVLGMRLTPSFSKTSGSSATISGETHANICVYAIVNSTNHTIKYGKSYIDYTNASNTFASADNGGNPVKDFNAIRSNATIGSSAVFDSANVGTLTNNDKFYKLFVIYAKGAGQYANGYYVNLAQDPTMSEMVSDYGKNAQFYKFTDSDNGNYLDPVMSLTFADTFMFGGESMTAEDVLEQYSGNLAIAKAEGTKYVSADSEGATTDEYDANGFDDFIADVGISDTMNFLLGESLTIGSTSWTITGGSSLTDLALSGAIDPYTALTAGKPSMTGTAFDESCTAFDTLFSSAYNGTITDMIYNQYRYPFQYMFAPTATSAVITNMHDLVGKRDITHAFYIVPDAATYAAQASAWNSTDTIGSATSAINSAENKNSWKELIYPEWAFARDPYTGKKIKVPSVYFNAYWFPRHWIINKGRPYAGISNFSWSDYVAGTVTPYSSSNETYIANHDRQWNSVVENGYGYAVPYEQITAQPVASALSEVNNTFVLTDMVRIALSISESKRWTFLNDAVVSEYRNEVINSISGELGDCYESLDVITARESVNGAGRNRIKCSITVKFRDMIKGVSYTFYIVANSANENA